MKIEVDLSDSAAWKQRYRAAAIAWTRTASGNPDRGLVCSNKDGVYQLYAWDTNDDSLRQLTRDSVGVGSGAISADGDHVYYLRDTGGDEKGHYVRLPWSGGDAIDISPDMPDYASHYFSECHSGRAYGFTAADDDGFRILIRANAPGAPTLFDRRWTALTFGPLMSHDAEIAVVASTEKTGVMEYALAAYDVSSGELIGELWDGAGSGMQAAGFSPAPGDLRLAATTSQSGFRRPLIWNPVTGERKDIDHEAFAGDVPAIAWSPDGERLLLHQWHQARQSLYICHAASGEVQEVNLPPGTGGGSNYINAKGNLMLHWSDAANPPRLLEVDGESGAVLRDVFDLNATLPSSVGFRSVTYQSEPGVEIQAWLATPPGKGPFPTIVHTHGGPTAVQTNSWMPAAQAWLNHGFAFFSLNFRGSTTFGYAFQHAIDGDLGAREVRDIAAGVAWLIDQGIADPSAILKTGGSYGGYLTLLALGKRPELWAGGMAVVAIADWRLMYEDQAATLRGYQRSLFGGTPDELPEAHQKSSPIAYAENYASPLLVIQGANDTRCPARQMLVFECKLKSLGKSIDVRWFDAGHGSRAIDQSIEHQAMMLEFAGRVLA